MLKLKMMIKMIKMMIIAHRPCHPLGRRVLFVEGTMFAPDWKPKKRQRTGQ
jgi:hypothetical protein